MGFHQFVGKSRSEDIAAIANATAKILELSVEIKPEEILSSEEYVGSRYGVVTHQSNEALRLVAEMEGIFLDPVYSSKAMAGLIDHIRKGKLKKSDNVVFIHTGGILLYLPMPQSWLSRINVYFNSNSRVVFWMFWRQALPPCKSASCFSR